MDYVVFEPGMVRAVDEKTQLFIIQKENVPVLPFGALGINRLDAFSDRLEMARSLPTFTMDVLVEKSRDPARFSDFARSITFKAKGLKAEYRCANPLTIKSPKQFGDQLMFQMDIPPDFITYLKRAKDAMQSDICNLVGDSDGVRMEVIDVNGDKLSYQFADRCFDITTNNVSQGQFSHPYAIKLLMTVLAKSEPTLQMTGRAGILGTVVNGLNVFMVPRLI